MKRSPAVDDGVGRRPIAGLALAYKVKNLNSNKNIIKIETWTQTLYKRFGMILII